MTSDLKRAHRILVVEDEPEIAALVAYQLTRDGFRVETVSDGLEALDAVARDVPDLVVLDRMLPGISGDEVLKHLKADPATRDVPILVLTAQREERERIEGFELGAEDYLTKPFSPRELVLRVRAILRRVEQLGRAAGRRILRVGPLEMDLDGHQVSLDDVELNLTPTEFRLLQVLLERRGRTQSRDALLESAWDPDAHFDDSIHSRTVDMHVRRLRGKLGRVGDWIGTVRGFGYRLTVPDDVR